MVPIEAVRLWAIDARRIGHVVYAAEQGWVSTVCDVWSPNLETQTEVPRRICSTCRSRLKTARCVTWTA